MKILKEKKTDGKKLLKAFWGILSTYIQEFSHTLCSYAI